MRTISVTKARSTLFQLVNEAANSHEPVQITGKKANVVLIAEEDWRSIQETMYLLSVPGMRESIVEGLQTPLAEASEDPGW
ncbi:MAG: type II toxin-antitoxin system Phd/YefM family antitoxin [Candidatus Marinimicrobia bacterium]|nr:type II toxin-antitoxin system Phd/YefM family antitoxin [Candidatus Neomarinimicrobiota bacterium]